MEQDIIKSKDPNIDQFIYQILNEAYQEFKSEYGEKHSEHIKSSIESITDKVRYDRDTYYMAATAMANRELGILYSTTKNVSAILKHEMWHVYNSTDRGNTLKTIPERYEEQLHKNGYIKNEYDKVMAQYKEEFKDEPQRLQVLLCSYEEYRNRDFGDIVETVEMWTEWFNTETHKKDMKPEFNKFPNGFFIERNSSGSYYDYYLNIANMISYLIPKEKLLDMYLGQEDYETGYTYQQMLEEFDEKYNGALEGSEQEYYKYPMLKIITNIITISDNASDNPQKALVALQSAMKTCFNAYLIKLDNTKELDVSKAKELFTEIKQMQGHMVWNIDTSKMQRQDYIQAMIRIQEKFKSMLNELDLSNPEVSQMLDNIDYTAENQFTLNQGGEKIVDIMLKTDTKDDVQITGNSNIKENLYRSLFVLLGKDKYKLLYQNFSENNEQDNTLLRIHKKIQNADTDEKIQDVYNEIYDLYLAKISERLDVSDNIQYDFKVVQNEIIELQKNGLFDEKNNSYMNKLEQIIDLYKQREQEYEEIIEKSIPSIIQKRIKDGVPPDRAVVGVRKFPDEIIGNLRGFKDNIDKQREEQIPNRQTTGDSLISAYQNMQITQSDVSKSFELLQKTKQEQEQIQDIQML